MADPRRCFASPIDAQICFCLKAAALTSKCERWWRARIHGGGNNEKTCVCHAVAHATGAVGHMVVREAAAQLSRCRFSSSSRRQ